MQTVVGGSTTLRWLSKVIVHDLVVCTPLVYAGLEGFVMVACVSYNRSNT